MGSDQLSNLEHDLNLLNRRIDRTKDFVPFENFIDRAIALDVDLAAAKLWDHRARIVRQIYYLHLLKEKKEDGN